MSWEIKSKKEDGDFVDVVVVMTRGNDELDTMTMEVNYRYPKSFANSDSFEEEIERAYKATFNL